MAGVHILTARALISDKPPMDRTFRLLALLLILVCGCDKGLKTYPVSGTVHFSDGTPLEGGTIVFHSVESQVQARGNVLEDGTFRVGTESPRDGAVAGSHRVVIRASWRGPSTPPERPVHSKYRSVSTTDLEYDVKTGRNKFEIVVEPSEKSRR